MGFRPSTRERHVELGYAERTSPDLTAQTGTAYADLTGLSLSGLTSGPDYDPTRPAWVHVHLPFVQHATAGKSIFAALYNIDGAAIVREAQALIDVGFSFRRLDLFHRFAPGALPAALKVQYRSDFTSYAIKFGGSPNLGSGFVTVEHR